MADIDEKVMEEFKLVTVRNYDKQAVFFLNAFWTEYGEEAERIWEVTHKFMELDDKGKDGNELDEFKAHKLLEEFGETLTVLKMREALRKIDIDSNKQMAEIEYLVYRYKQSVQELMDRPQGTNEALEKAQRALEDVQNEIERIESKKAELEAKAAGSGVKANMAKNELAQLLGADQTDLNRAMLTAEAAVRKAKKMGGGEAQGALWWIERQLEEQKKYKPRGGLAHGF